MEFSRLRVLCFVACCLSVILALSATFLQDKALKIGVSSEE